MGQQSMRDVPLAALIAPQSVLYKPHAALIRPLLRIYMTETICGIGIGVLFNATADHVRDQLLEGEKEHFGLGECGVEFDGHAQLITVLQSPRS